MVVASIPMESDEKNGPGGSKKIIYRDVEQKIYTYIYICIYIYMCVDVYIMVFYCLNLVNQ